MGLGHGTDGIYGNHIPGGCDWEEAGCTSQSLDVEHNNPKSFDAEEGSGKDAEADKETKN